MVPMVLILVALGDNRLHRKSNKSFQRLKVTKDKGHKANQCPKPKKTDGNKNSNSNPNDNSKKDPKNNFNKNKGNNLKKNKQSNKQLSSLDEIDNYKDLLGFYGEDIDQEQGF